MRKWLWVLAVILSFIQCITVGIKYFKPASAQMTITGVGGGFGPSGGGGGITGPLDVISSANAFYSLRCASNAYVGSVIDIVDSATGNTTGTRLQCTGGVAAPTTLVSASACTFVTGNACSLLTSTCTVACKVVTWYDQSGANACSSAPCNATQATNANRPTFLTSGCSYTGTGVVSWCVQFSNSAATILTIASFAGGAQPETEYCAHRWSGGGSGNNLSCFGTGDVCCGNSSPSLQIDAAPEIRMAQVNAVVQAISSATWYATIAVWNGAAGLANNNGSAFSGLATGTDGSVGHVYIGGDAFGNNYDGFISECGIWQSAQTATPLNNLVTNARSSTNGFNF